MKKLLYILTVLSFITFPETLSFAQNCENSVAQIDLSANNVRARLLVGGDLWWNGADGRYIVPKVPPGQPEIASFFAGAIWMGGFDSGNDLRLAAQTYGRSSGDFDYFPGPINSETGTTDQETCLEWDQFFLVTRTDIEAHIADFEDNGVIDGPVPTSVLGWPGRNSPSFYGIHLFDLPNTNQSLAPFFDRDGNNIYDPMTGDYPMVNGDETIWWIYNDLGNTHAETMGDPIGMEIQTTAFSYDSMPPYLNNTTFYEYKFTYRGTEVLDSFHISIWADPDLGCYEDDLVGCVPGDRLAFVYNGDDMDEDCVALGYGAEIPIAGIKVLETTPDLPFSSFMYYLNGTTPGAPTATFDPSDSDDFYQYMTATWLDGTPLTLGGIGYQTGEPYPYAFDGTMVDSEEMGQNARSETRLATGGFC